MPYVGLLLNKNVHLFGTDHLFGSDTAIVSFFAQYEHGLDAKSQNLLYASVAAVQADITKENLDAHMFICVELAKKLAKHDTKHADLFFNHGLLLLKSFRNTKNMHLLAEKYLGLLELCTGTEEKTIAALSDLKPLLDRFGLVFFDDFLLPITQSQTVATFMILESMFAIHKRGGIHDQKDLDLIKHVSKTYLTKANVILKDVIIKGIEKDIIPVPISTEADIIKAFIRNTPAYIIDLYPQFRQLYANHPPVEREKHTTELFKNIRALKQEIYDGRLTKQYDNETLFAVLYYVFACHDMTVPKENYAHTYNQRQDRSADIPIPLQKPISIRLSKGGFTLKKESGAVNTQAWNLIIKAVDSRSESSVKVLNP